MTSLQRPSYARAHAHQAACLLMLMVCMLPVWCSAKLYTIRSWDSLSDQEVSRMGKAVIRLGRDTWTHAESERFICHAQSDDVIAEVLRKAEVVSSYVDSALGLPSPMRKMRMFVITSEKTWVSIKRRRGWRMDGLSLQYENEVVFLYTGEDAPIRDEIPHEIVHSRLRDAYQLNLPVALEEGIALMLGWEANYAYHRRKGRSLKRTLPQFEPANLMRLQELETQTDYPTDPALAQAFYRQAEVWVRGIRGITSRERFSEFVKKIGSDERPWREVLQEDFDCSDGQLLMLRDAVHNGSWKSEETGSKVRRKKTKKLRSELGHLSFKVGSGVDGSEFKE